MSWQIDITTETLPAFNDPSIHTCYIDGQTFDDAGVYQMHMLMFHGVNIDVKADDGSIIKAPVNPVIPPPSPDFIPAPGVSLVPLPGGNYTVSSGGGIAGSQLDNTKPLTTTQTTTGGNASVGWAMAGIIGAIIAFGWTRKARRTR